MSPMDLLALPPHERLALIEARWDSLGEAPPFPAAQAAELANRLQSFAQDRPAAMDWDTLKAELEHRPR